MLDPLMRQLVYLTSSKLERSGDVLVCAFTRDEVRLTIHLLAPKDLSLRAEALGQTSPSPLYRGEVIFRIQHPMVNASCQSEAKETAPASLGVRILVRIVEVDAPQAIGSLTLDQFRRLPPKDSDVVLPAGVALRKVL